MAFDQSSEHAHATLKVERTLPGLVVKNNSTGAMGAMGSQLACGRPNTPPALPRKREMSLPAVSPAMNASLKTRALGQYRKLMLSGSGQKKRKHDTWLEDELPGVCLASALQILERQFVGRVLRQRDWATVGSRVARCVASLRASHVEVWDERRQAAAGDPAPISLNVPALAYGMPSPRSVSCSGSRSCSTATATSGATSSYQSGSPSGSDSDQGSYSYSSSTGASRDSSSPSVLDAGLFEFSAIDAAAALDLSAVHVALELGEADSAVRIGVAQSRGSRPAMEDAYFVCPHLDALYESLSSVDSPAAVTAASAATGAREPTAFVGVYDGHNGFAAARFAAMQLHLLVAAHEGFASGGTAGLATAITSAFVETDRRFTAKARLDGLTDGTTATVVFVRGDSLIVANVGDSHAVLATDGHARLVSTAHTPHRPDEEARIIAAGGSVVWFGTWRVNGILAVSRSIGDPQVSDVVIPDPELQTFALTSAHQAVIVATDGLWDVVSPDEAVALVLRLAREGVSETMIARTLVDEAALRKSADNCTCVVVLLPSLAAGLSRSRAASPAASAGVATASPVTATPAPPPLVRTGSMETGSPSLSPPLKRAGSSTAVLAL